MIRVLCCLLFASVTTLAAEVAPAPRLVGQGDSLDPAKTVERIIRDSQAVGDRLAMLDPGRDTRDKQGGILKDIDALIKQQENPPPMPKDSPPMSKSGENEPQPKGSRPMPGLPSDQKDKQPSPPQRAHRNQPRPGGEKKPQPEPIAKEKGPAPKQGEPIAKAGVGSAVAPKPQMPLAGDVEKDVWGHLPEQLRQQVSTYYRQQFMPQYADLLRQYYSSLSEREPKPGPKQ